MHARRSDVAGGPAPASDAAGEPAPEPHRLPRVTSFRTRRSTLSGGQQETWDRRWPELGMQARDDDARPVVNLDTAAWFGRSAPVVLEIGFGMGEATAEMASADPDTGIIAADVHTPGQGNLLRLAERAGLTNVRVANGDAILLLREMLPERSLAGLRIFFPDPWPKKRHHKRRLVQPEFVALAASRLAPDAVLHCATDWAPYAEWMLEVIGASEEFVNTAPDGGFAPRPANRPVTRFERQGLAKGHRVRDLVFRRLP